MHHFCSLIGIVSRESNDISTHPLKSYVAEMDEMECPDLEVSQEVMVGRETEERLEPLDHRDLLDPGVVKLLICERGRTTYPGTEVVCTGRAGGSFYARSGTGGGSN